VSDAVPRKHVVGKLRPITQRHFGRNLNGWLNHLRTLTLAGTEGSITMKLGATARSAILTINPGTC
jgi:hypothetical protein